MKNNRRTLIIRIGIILAILLSIFIFSRILPFLLGPRIIDINIEEYQYLHQHSLNLEAKVAYTQSAKVNGVSSQLTQEGIMRHFLALNPGYNLIEVELEDTFGNTKKESFHIIAPDLENIKLPEDNEEILETTHNL
ncbi:hypothetical protein GW765_03615 [Candidatus Parcubacteria bacterium]|nr:hypothetical protein [Candidatus Parcubacteria bacterium]